MAKIMSPVEFLKRLKPGGIWVLTAIKPIGKGIETVAFADPSAAVTKAKREGDALIQAAEDALAEAKAADPPCRGEDDPVPAKERHLHTTKKEAKAMILAADPVTQWVEKWDGRWNLFYMVNRASRQLTKKATKRDVAAMTHLHIDVDDPSDEALARLKAFDPPPTLIIFSGGGYNALWKLAEPVAVTEENLDELEAYNRALIEPLGGDKACFNIDRILRLPGTWNMPNAKKKAAGRVPRVAKLVYHAGGTTAGYTLDQFAQAESVRAVRRRNGAPPVQLENPAHLPEVVVDDLPLDDRMKIIIQEGYDPGEPDLYASRSEAVCAVILAMLDAGMSHEMMCSVLTDKDLGISGYCRDHPQPVWCAMRQIQRVKERLFRG